MSRRRSHCHLPLDLSCPLRSSLKLSLTFASGETKIAEFPSLLPSICSLVRGASQKYCACHSITPSKLSKDSKEMQRGERVRNGTCSQYISQLPNHISKRIMCFLDLAEAVSLTVRALPCGLSDEVKNQTKTSTHE